MKNLAVIFAAVSKLKGEGYGRSAAIYDEHSRRKSIRKLGMALKTFEARFDLGKALTRQYIALNQSRNMRVANTNFSRQRIDL